METSASFEARSAPSSYPTHQPDCGLRLSRYSRRKLPGVYFRIVPGCLTVAEAERCLRTAIDVARRQGARLFELRASVALARSMANQGRRDIGCRRQEMGPGSAHGRISGWFGPASAIRVRHSPRAVNSAWSRGGP